MTQTDRERIEELATAYVCPLNFSPSTPYELGMVRTYTTFALIVIEKLGYTRQPEPTEIELVAEKQVEEDLRKFRRASPSSNENYQVETVKRELEYLLRLDEEVVEWINSKDHPGTKEMR